LWLILLS